MANISCNASDLGQWLKHHGGSYNHELYFNKTINGKSIHTKNKLESGTVIVKCPFALAITPNFVRSALPTLSPLLKSDHAMMISYLILHLVYPSSTPSSKTKNITLNHYAYVATLPAVDQMNTPVYYSEVERALLKGTNLYGAASERRSDWINEFIETSMILDDWKDLSPDDRRKYTCELFVYFGTILSSRAFPSSLIPGYVSSTTSSTESVPVLFPGVDMFNHEYGRKVTWSSAGSVISSEDGAAETISQEVGGLTIQINSPAEAGAEVFNNYGPKSNEELLLGYGFILSPNNSDTVVLKVSLTPFLMIIPDNMNTIRIEIQSILKAYGLEELRHFVPVSGVMPDQLIAQMRLLGAYLDWKVGDDRNQDELDDVQKFDYEQLFVDLPSTPISSSGEPCYVAKLAQLPAYNTLDALDSLLTMTSAKLEEAQAVIKIARGAKIRPDVKKNIDEYRSGQVMILEKAVAYLDDALGNAMEMAMFEKFGGGSEEGGEVGEEREDEE